VEKIYAGATNTNPRMGECHVGAPKVVPECHYGGPLLGAIVIGDSHSASIMTAVQKALGDPQRYVLDWSFSSCPTLLGVKMNGPRYTDNCGKFLQHALERSRELDPAAPLIVLNRSSSYLYGPNDIGRENEQGQVGIYFDKSVSPLTPELAAQFKARLIETACQFARHRPVYLMRPVPELRYDVPRTMARMAELGKPARVSISMQDAARERCGVHILNPLPYLCHEGRCWGDKDGIPIYYDDDHLNELGGEQLLPMFRQVVSLAHG
jgi:hypothetical protein